MMEYIHKHAPRIYDPETGQPRCRPFHLYLVAKLTYHQSKQIMSDEVYDRLETSIRKRFPDCPALRVIGVPSAKDAKALSEWWYKRYHQISA